jgi:cell division protein YceG involved in septum cleavage
MTRRRIVTWLIVLCIIVIVVALYFVLFSTPARVSTPQQFTVAQNTSSAAQIIGNLHAQGFIKNDWAFGVALYLRKGTRAIAPGGYELSQSMNAWEVAGVLVQKPALVWAVIPEGLRKEQIASILAQALDWTSAQESEWINVDTANQSRLL